MPPEPTLDPACVAQEATDYLQRLIRFDTTNPPGNEVACARWIAEVFEKEGIASEVLEPLPGRGSVVARIPGTGEKRPLVLLSHLDVVPAVAADWLQDPFSGVIVDGEIWGRGTLDTKGLTAIWMVIMLAVKRLGLPLDRDLVFAATADEEAGGTWGVGWIVQNRPELLNAEFILNEGGGMGHVIGGRTFYLCQTAEKGICWVRVTAHGTAGHAAVPHSDNPVIHLAAALQKIGTSHLPLHITETFRLFIDRVAADLPEPLSRSLPLVLHETTSEKVLSEFQDARQADAFRAMLRNTANPTVVSAGSKTNVIPQTATAEVDCRILPGQTPDNLLAELRQVLDLEGKPEEKIQLEIVRTSIPTESPPDTPLTDAVRRAMAKHYPEATVVPFLVPGATDGRFLRPTGAICYGFCPVLPDVDTASVHGKNERLPLRSLEFGVRVLWDIVTDVAGTNGKV